MHFSGSWNKLRLWIEFCYRQREHDTQTRSARRKSINANMAVFIVLATEQGDLHIEVEEANW